MANVAFIGLGVMGYPMAGHLQRAGHQVTVYNRTAEKAARWVQEYGGRFADTPASAARGQDFVLLCVGNDDDLRAVVCGELGVFAGSHKGQVVVDHTTASAGVARELAQAAAQLGVGFLDAPVSGGQAGAEAGTLTIMVGGEESEYRRAVPLLEVYAKKHLRMGPAGPSRSTAPW